MDDQISESNNVDIINRSGTLGREVIHMVTGANSQIQRNGVIKQWKYYSKGAGHAAFYVLRPTGTPRT